MLVADGRIAKVFGGGDTDAAAESVVEANGGTLLPGFIDSHCHPFDVGRLKRIVDLRGSANINAVRLRLAARLQRVAKGEWLLGDGWDQESFADRRFPNRADLDDLTPGNPVILTRICGHVALLNTAAIRALRLEDERSATYERDGSGGLTGIIKEGALVDAYSRLPPPTSDSLRGDLAAADFDAAKVGLTTLHCIVSRSAYAEELEAIMQLAAAGSLNCRMDVLVPPESLGRVEGLRARERLEGTKARIAGVKIFADGSLGARTAALREPYSDEPGNSGILIHDDDELGQLVEKADSLGYQAAVHAIGDRAVEQAIGAISRLGRNEKRHRIEHASLLPPDLRSKMKRYGICAAVQPQFITSDTWAEERLGERARDLYPLKSLLKDGVLIAGSSDAPVETMNPVLGVWSAAVRGGYGQGERLSVAEGCDLYTINAAKIGHEEAETGTLEEGMRADLVLLDSDIEGMHPSMFRKVGVALTMSEGSTTYSYETP